MFQTKRIVNLIKFSNFYQYKIKFLTKTENFLFLLFTKRKEKQKREKNTEHSQTNLHSCLQNQKYAHVTFYANGV
jgi:bisphosphoglycerate-independent phosphoglycerate mutase (AlkP superfamily)